METIKCPKCGEIISANFTKQGKKYFSHPLTKDEKRSCYFSSWVENLPSTTIIVSEKKQQEKKQEKRKIFISSKKDFILHFSLSTKLVSEAKEQLLRHTILREDYIQTGRFVGKIKDTIDSIYKLDFISAIYDDLYSREQELKDLIFETSCKQICDSDFLYAVFTEGGQHQVVAEIHFALSKNIPVFLKFCNCDDYDAKEEYWYTISAVKTTASATAALVKSSSSTDNITVINSRGVWGSVGEHSSVPSLIKNNWKSEEDYLNYLSVVPICRYCHESFSELLTTKFTVLHSVALSDHRDDDSCINSYDQEDVEVGTEIIKSTDHVCHACLAFLQKSLKKCVNGSSTQQSHTDLVLEYLGKE